MPAIVTTVAEKITAVTTVTATITANPSRCDDAVPRADDADAPSSPPASTAEAYPMQSGEWHNGAMADIRQPTEADDGEADVCIPVVIEAVSIGCHPVRS